MSNELALLPEKSAAPPIFASIESILANHKKARELSEMAAKTQEHLDKWSNNRRRTIQKMEEIAVKLDNWEKGCAISTTVGSSVGVFSGFAVIGGLVLMPTVAITGLIVGAAAGISNVATGLVKHSVWSNLNKEVVELLQEDSRLFEILLQSREELMEALKRIMDDEEFAKLFEKDDDILNNLKSVFGASVTGVMGFGARYAMMSMGRLSSSLTKGVLHSVAVIGIILDGVTLALSATTLFNGSTSEFGAKLRAESENMKQIRQNVVKNFLNQDVWEAEDDDQLSDVGSAEVVSPVPMPQQLAAE